MIFCFFCLFCVGTYTGYTQTGETPGFISDYSFWQEYHVAYPLVSEKAGQVRSISVGPDGNVWVATGDGFFCKKEPGNKWEKLVFEENKGPAYAVLAGEDGTIWLGNWRGLFRLYGNEVKKISGTTGPISVLCPAVRGLYAFGPGGMWLYEAGKIIPQPYKIARSVRAAVADKKGGVWVTSDVGLYHCFNDTAVYYFDTRYLISAYAKGLAFDATDRLWVATLGGVTVLNGPVAEKKLTPENGVPSVYTHCVALAPDSSIWVGTDVGVVRFHPDGKHSLRFSRRWLLDDKVNTITFDKNGTAWVGTDKGVSAIGKKQMSLADKQQYFYDVTMQRHVRAPWIVGQCRLPDPENLNRWEPEDDDNDGEYGGNYLAMESFRYAVTKSEDARIKAKKSFDFLRLLQTITETDGFFARTIVPIAWGNNVHDANRIYTPVELAEELVKEPRFKPVETRWHKSKDGKWLWKGDTSSDEWCGHMMGYFFYYELVADKTEKKRVATHVSKLVDHLIKNNFNMIDVDGTHTRWSVWSPDNLNRDPEWRPDRYQNSMEALSFLKLAYYMTGNEKYQSQYTRLIKEEKYLENASKLLQQNPAWFIYFDVVLQAYLYPILIHCETDPELRRFYEQQMDSWMATREQDHCPLINFFYSYARQTKYGLTASVAFLEDTPLDLVNWGIDHTKREDVTITRAPVLDELQVKTLPPASIRATVRWDKNPWTAVNGATNTEREPVFWLLPYWMGRYLKMIQ